MTILYTAIATAALLIAIMAINTMYKKPGKETPTKPVDIVLDKEKLAKNLSGMIRFKTISSATVEGCDKKAFLEFHKYLEKTYPLEIGRASCRERVFRAV